jgi:serine/threonine/tyrosine protein kinase RAD53
LYKLEPILAINSYFIVVAVKIIDKNRFNLPSEKIFTLRNEVIILKDLSHPNVVKLLHVYEKADIICIFMDILDGGDLVEYILTIPEKKLSERLSKSI